MRVVLIPLLLLAGATAQTRPAGPLEPWLDAQLPELIELYRDLHQHPELSFREVETAARIAAELEHAGCEVTRNVGGLGVVGMLRNGAGKLLMLRADLDALPLGEQTGVDYMSKTRVESDDGRVAGVMHACGHDIHMTNLIGTARWLADHRDAWSGTVMFIGQPAEERAGGAKAMLADGLFERFGRPDFALALHVTHDLPAGSVGWRAGPAMANVESVDVIVRGRGGHGAAPHLTVDPIVIAAGLILDLQTIVSRELDPIEPAVVTVGSIHGGAKHNIIDAECRLQITIRSYTLDVHERIKSAIVRKARAAAAAALAPEPEVQFSEFTPALVNDAGLTERVAAVLVRELGADSVLEIEPVMGAEDFGRFGDEGIPIVMFRLGSIGAERFAMLRERGEAPPPLHSAFYWPDAEPTLRTGIRATVTLAIDLLPRRN